jgi:DNA-binding MarR family transcriptional regulator
MRPDHPMELDPAAGSAHGTPEPSTSGRRRGLNLGPLAKLLGFRLRRAQLVVYEDFRRGAPAAQLAPGQLGILVLIDENPEMTQQQLCEGIGVDKSTFAISLDRLADRGLLRRVRSEDDRRRNSLRLTAKGKATLKAMLVHVERHERRVFAKLSAAERAQLMEMLKKLGEPKVSR